MAFGIRGHGWQDGSVVSVSGEFDVEAAAQLGRRLERLQRDRSVFVDLWDVTFIEPDSLGVLTAAKQRADATRWDFAVIADPGGVVARAIEAAGLEHVLETFPTKHDARAAMRRA